MSTMLNTLSRDTPPGYNNIRVEQLIRADRELFTILSREVRGSLKPDAHGVSPLDAQVTALITDPRMTMFMLPLPVSQKAIKDEVEKGTTKDDPAPVLKAPKIKKKKARAEKACPEELKKYKLNYVHGRICWGFNLKDGCSLTTQKQAGWEARKVQQTAISRGIVPRLAGRMRIDGNAKQLQGTLQLKLL